VADQVGGVTGELRREGGFMKVVLFCGGFGVRMGEETQRIPKPMITVGNQPILWHIMKWYASWGHDDFILCLGYRAETIKEYFLNYNEALSNDFILSNGGRDVELLGSDISAGGSGSSTRASSRPPASGSVRSVRILAMTTTFLPPTATGSPMRRFRR
jgi:NDP-sugar pyrophosphorylase family protein